MCSLRISATYKGRPPLSFPWIGFRKLFNSVGRWYDFVFFTWYWCSDKYETCSYKDLKDILQQKDSAAKYPKRFITLYGPSAENLELKSTTQWMYLRAMLLLRAHAVSRVDDWLMVEGCCLVQLSVWVDN